MVAISFSLSNDDDHIDANTLPKIVKGEVWPDFVVSDFRNGEIPSAEITNT